MAIEKFLAQGKGALESCKRIEIGEQKRKTEKRGTIRTFLVGVDRTNMSLKVFPAVETLATTDNSAHIESLVFRIRVGGDGRLRWNAPATTLFRQVGNRSWQRRPRPW